MVKKEPQFVLLRCRRDEYIRAWKEMYALDKRKWNAPMFDGINPMLNKTPLDTEVDNFCAVMFDMHESGETKYGRPVGIFSMVVTRNKTGNVKPIGKQFVVDPDYQRRGLGSALLMELEKWLKEEGYTWYYIGCSSMSARIERSFCSEPFSEDPVHDLAKFNINLNRDNFDDQYVITVQNNKEIKVVREEHRQ